MDNKTIAEKGLEELAFRIAEALRAMPDDDTGTPHVWQLGILCELVCVCHWSVEVSTDDVLPPSKKAACLLLGCIKLLGREATVPPIIRRAIAAYSYMRVACPQLNAAEILGDDAPVHHPHPHLNWKLWWELHNPTDEGVSVLTSFGAGLNNARALVSV